MDWQAHFRMGDAQDMLFLSIRDRFPELTDAEFREQVMASISSGVFQLPIDLLLAEFPSDLAIEALRALDHG